MAIVNEELCLLKYLLCVNHLVEKVEMEKAEMVRKNQLQGSFLPSFHTDE